MQNCYGQRKNVCLCFIDYEKAFDKVRHHKLMNALKRMDMNQKDNRCIENLYWNQEAQIKIGGEISNTVRICRRIRQECMISPLLFNIYPESIFQRALEDIERGIKINRVWLNNIRYADNIMLIADNDK